MDKPLYPVAAAMNQISNRGWKDDRAPASRIFIEPKTAVKQPRNKGRLTK